MNDPTAAYERLLGEPRSGHGSRPEPTSREALAKALLHASRTKLNMQQRIAELEAELEKLRAKLEVYRKRDIKLRDAMNNWIDSKGEVE